MCMVIGISCCLSAIRLWRTILGRVNDVRPADLVVPSEVDRTVVVVALAPDLKLWRA